MKTVHFFIFILMLVFSSNFTHLFAQQNKISLQSTLKDISGKAIPDGDVNVTFKLYHQMEQGQAQWTESATVSVVGGIYSHKLGSVTPLPASIFGLPLYLGVTVGGGQELAPRTELTSAPYAISVGALAGGGQSASFESNGTFSVTGNAKVNGNLHIPDNASQWELTLGGTNHGILRESNRLNIADNGTGRVLLFDNGLNQLFSHNGNGIELFQDNSQKFRTDAAGTITTGRHAVFGNLELHAGGNINTQGGDVFLGPTGNLDASFANNPSNTMRWVKVGDSDTGIRSSQDGVLQVVTNDYPILHLSNGRLGVNQASPQAGLHVAFPYSNQDAFQGYSFDYTGLSYFNGSGMHHYTSSTSNQPLGGPDGGTLFNVAAIFDGSVVSYKGIWSAQNLQFSDKRIKNIQGRSNSTKDLSLLNSIKITDYTMIDKVLDKNSYKKVVAQEIQEIYHQAVSKSRNVIPNIMSPAESSVFDNKTLTITLNSEHKLKCGDHIDILSKEKKLTDAEVIKIIDENSFVINSEIDLTQIYVYGKYVDDFLSVDYDALSMLNFSATQELYKRLVELETENKALKTTTAKLEDRMERIEAMLTSNTADVIETKTLVKK